MWIYSPVSQMDDSIRVPRKKQERPSRTREYTNSLEYYFETNFLILLSVFFYRNVQQYKEKTRGKTSQDLEGFLVPLSQQNMFWL